MNLLFIILATLLAGSQISPVPALVETRSSPKAPPHPRQSASRTIRISLEMNIHNEKIFEDDKEYTRNETLRPILVSEPNGLTKIARYSTRAGGKILVEVLLTVTLRPLDLSVEVHYVVELYNEGRDPSFSKPAGYISGSRVAGRDKYTEIKVTVSDMEYETGDKADVALNISNTASF